MPDAGPELFAELAERTTIERLRRLAPSPGVDTLAGPGWLAVRTGVQSNDLNGVLPVTDAPLTGLEPALAFLVGLPASVLTAPRHGLAPASERLLVDVGARPETTGVWCGRALATSHPPGTTTSGEGPDPAGVEQVLGRCGWWHDSADRDRRHALAVLEAERDDGALLTVRVDGTPVAALRAFAGSALEIVDVAVLPEHRRRGHATRLVEQALVWGASRGRAEVVAAPSPDGARLFAALGFTTVPVTPGACWYLPLDGEAG